MRIDPNGEVTPVRFCLFFFASRLILFKNLTELLARESKDYNDIAQTVATLRRDYNDAKGKMLTKIICFFCSLNF